MDEGKMMRELKKHAKLHNAQQLRRPPLLPFHYVVFDPMHGIHNEINVLLDEAVHRHLIIETKNTDVLEVLQKAQKLINELWKNANLSKFIQFGPDSGGHALNGPAFKAVMRSPTLLIDTIALMQPVYGLLETHKLTPELSAAATGEAADVGPVTLEQMCTAAKKKPAKKVQKRKERGVQWQNDVETPSTPSTSTGGSDTIPTPETEVPSTEKATIDLSYSQRVGIAFVTFIQFYMYLHADHDVPASKLDATARSERGDTAVELAVAMQRGMLALIGSHRRRTYAHDFVYGTHQLYMLFGKPWNAATEGNEHAHQDMKAFFHKLACHSSKGHSDCYAVLRLLVVKRQSLIDHWDLLPNSNYAAMRANRTLPPTATGQGSKTCGAKRYKNDDRMLSVAHSIQTMVVDVCPPCAT